MTPKEIDQEIERLIKLKEELNKPKVESIKEIYDLIQPKYASDITGNPRINEITLPFNSSTEQLAKHCLMYIQFKEVEKFVNENNDIDFFNETNIKYDLYIDSGNIILAHVNGNHVCYFNFFSKQARAEFIRIVGEENLIEFYKTAYIK